MFYTNEEIPNLLDDPNVGLLPFLEDKLQINWERFKIRPWLFDGTKTGEAGFALGPLITEPQGVDTRAVLEVRLGYIITVEQEQLAEKEAQRRALFLSLEIDKYTRQWACCTPQLGVECVGITDGDMPAIQNPQQSSENPNAWYVVIIRKPMIAFLCEGHQNG